MLWAVDQLDQPASRLIERVDRTGQFPWAIALTGRSPRSVNGWFKGQMSGSSNGEITDDFD
ncbi:hypothetical protein AMR42_06245 [Limnothrix sp. PR1529]|nr:hypothetical protein BCR12_14630 [Limnothrix sp. P13C2]PIB14381.1 hypothetical protein AMR42_06245 [Limnothrix sp. PR1529]